ncbi:16S rRNA (guanine(527)-N(7))-methyltransferase RsmG [Cereibacter sp. SYSU M97828]|nr:16S rRNA (guanine(527)-N(7))-methyltransferase RsmG [Cereibacter flavus]
MAEFAALALKWNPAINLIAKSTVADIHNRHIADSAQLYDLADDFTHWVDLGSGGGFPGIVIATIAREKNPSAKITMVESDQRKCEFLRHASRTLGLDTQVLNARIEAAEPLDGDVVSARALTALDQLCVFFQRHKTKDGVGLFPKGVSAAQELAAALETWNMDYRSHQSITDPSAVILEVRDLSRVRPAS